MHASKLKEVGDFCFTACSRLRRIPKSVAVIGKWSFSSCTSLTKIELPHLKVVPESAFQMCRKVTKVILDNVEEVRTSAFEENIRLVEVHLPNVKKFKAKVFSGCNAIELFEIPDLSMIDIDAEAFDKSDIEILEDGRLYLIARWKRYSNIEV